MGSKNEGDAGALPIEQGAERFLSENAAPREIEADWLDWVTQTGTAVWDRPGLTRAERSLITIAMLSVLREDGPLGVHVEAGLANGLSREQICEVLMHSAVYAGVPQALRSMRVSRHVFDHLEGTSRET